MAGGYYGCNRGPGGCGCPQAARKYCNWARWVPKEEDVNLNEKQRCIMAAILGISNLGMDNVFIGRDPEWTPKDVGEYYRSERTGDVSVENAVIAFGRGFLENDQMAEMFIDESEHWYEQLKTKEDVVKTRMGAFLEAMQ